MEAEGPIKCPNTKVDWDDPGKKDGVTCKLTGKPCVTIRHSLYFGNHPLQRSTWKNCPGVTRLVDEGVLRTTGEGSDKQIESVR